jgi:hypothetical protein
MPLFMRGERFQNRRMPALALGSGAAAGDL